MRIIVLALAIAAAGLAAETTDIEYGVAEGVSLKLDASVPDGAGPFPVVLIVHGGGWSSGDKQEPDLPALFEPLKAARFTWFSVNYRLGPQHKFPACLEDVERAIDWVKAHAAEYKGDPRRIVLLGHSAGGHLVVLAAVRATEGEQVQGVVALAAPVDLVSDTERRGGPSQALQNIFSFGGWDEAARETLYDASPINGIRPGLPPFLLIHGTTDRSVLYRQSIRLDEKLRASNVPVELVTIENAPHAFLEWSSFDPGWTAKLVSWLQHLFKQD